MKSLEKVKIWSGDGYGSNPVTLTQLKRTDKVALYEASRDGAAKGYEVFIIKLRLKGAKLPGGMVEEDDREVYPSANQFGKIAWYIHNKKAAEHRYEELVKNSNVPDEVEDETPAVAMVIPIGEFTTTELSVKLGIPYPQASNLIKEQMSQGTIKFVREEQRNAKGKKSKIFVKTS